MKHLMESNLKVIVFENCKAASYEYYIGEEDDVVTVFRLNVDESVWKVVRQRVIDYFELDLSDSDITWRMLDTAIAGYIEEEDIAIYCDTAIGYNYKKTD